MTRVPDVEGEALDEFQPLFSLFEQVMGFVPNSMRTMAHRPDLLRAFAALASTVMGGASIAPDLRQLVAFVASNAAGCRYCQAHTSHSAHRMGASALKIEAAFEFETSPLFSEAERAALRLASHGGVVPNAVEDADMEEVRRHFGDGGAVDIVAIIALFGWLNRWNDTMATTLEREPATWGATNLAKLGWTEGKHAGHARLPEGRKA